MLCHSSKIKKVATFNSKLANADAAYFDECGNSSTPSLAFLASSHLATDSLKVAQGWGALIALKLDLVPHKHCNCNLSGLKDVLYPVSDVFLEKCFYVTFFTTSVWQLWELHSSSSRSFLCKSARNFFQKCAQFLSKLRTNFFQMCAQLAHFFAPFAAGVNKTVAGSWSANEDKTSANVGQEWKLRDLFQSSILQHSYNW